MNLINKSSLKQSVQRLIPFCLLLGIIAMSLLSLVGYIGWYLVLELLSHFRFQYLLISFILFGCIALTRQKSLILIGLFCLALNLTEIADWYIPEVGINSATGNLRVLSSNINIKNSHYSKVISFVKKERPDIAIIMEVNEAGIKQLSSLNEILPYSVTSTKSHPDQLGIVVYSKLPLDNTSVKFFGTSTNPSILADLKINGQVISLIATHPPPPFKPALFQVRNQHLDEMSQYVQQLKNPVVLAGDLNITMWSPYYRKFVSQTKLRNSRKGFGVLPSWPMKANYSHYSKIPPLLSSLVAIPIDHCLISPGLKVSNIRTGENVNSDHLPLIIDLVIPKAQ
ncbi:MAG TPA: endonuclease/exonuclease/phosphatase [Cyanobacteria bacterium UBA8553]|nr:endonuclease/exonuclease/phosphatase [Cyanobacteria bacterium UBA8553]HAJ61080.1 endonuclease/exonuclease/phosphatase [Cyanobacteria bacterium UBA8543]